MDVSVGEQDNVNNNNNNGDVSNNDDTDNNGEETNQVAPRDQPLADDPFDEFRIGSPQMQSSPLRPVQMGSFRIYPYGHHNRSESDEPISFNDEGQNNEVLDISVEIEK